MGAVFAHFGRGAPDDDQEGEERFADTYGAEEGDDRVHEAVGAAPAHPGPFVDVDAFAELSDRVYTSSAAERSVHAALFERIRAGTGCLASAAAKSVAANDMLSGWVSTNWRCALPSANTYSAWSAVLDAAVCRRIVGWTMAGEDVGPRCTALENALRALSSRVQADCPPDSSMEESHAVRSQRYF